MSASVNDIYKSIFAREAEKKTALEAAKAAGANIGGAAAMAPAGPASATLASSGASAGASQAVAGGAANSTTSASLGVSPVGAAMIGAQFLGMVQQAEQNRQAREDAAQRLRIDVAGQYGQNQNSALDRMMQAYAKGLGV